MTEEDEAFNEIERQARQRKEAVMAAMRRAEDDDDIQVYQRPWVGLTDEEIYSVLENLQVMHHRPPTTDSRIVFARAIEAAHGIKGEA